METIIIEKGNVLIKAFQFITKGAETSDTNRAYYKTLHVEFGGKEVDFVCTDGRRLHRFTTNADDSRIAGFEDGDYSFIAKSDLITFQKRQDGGYMHFPEWRRVIPKINENQLIHSGFADKKELEQFIFPIYSAGLKMKEKQLADLDGFEWKVYGAVTSGAVTFTSDYFQLALQAVIMPLQETFSKPDAFIAHFEKLIVQAQAEKERLAAEKERRAREIAEKYAEV